MFWTAQSTFSESFRAYTDAFPNEWQNDRVEEDKRLAEGAEVKKRPLPPQDQRMKSSSEARAVDGTEGNKTTLAASGKYVAGTTAVKSEQVARKGHSFVVGSKS